MSVSNQRETAIVAAARQLAPAERVDYLDKACAGDAALRERVEGAVTAETTCDPFLEQSTRVFDPPAAQASPAADMPGETVGDMVGRYKLMEKIGEGGFGAVYVAEQREPVTRQVALKVVKLGMDTRQVVARFERERQALAMMEHPHIAKVLDAGAMENGRPYFVMELVRGIRITDYCDEHKLSTRERLRLFLKTCYAIQHAHQKGIIHRDIKPSNILVTSNDGAPAPKVIDFGIAKATQGDLTDDQVHTQFQQLIGTPAYMSPEQVETGGRDLDTRSDIYSLGVLLYELLTGRTPLKQEELLNAGADQLRRLIVEKDPPPPSTRLTTMLEGELTNLALLHRVDPPKLIRSLRGDLDWIVMKCLEKDRARRYQTVNELALDIQRHLNHEPVLARPQSQYYRLQKLVRRHRLAAAAATAVALCLLAGIGVSAWQAARATRAQRQADIARQRAEESAIRTQAALAASDFLQGIRLISQDSNNDALAYLARGLVANPTNVAALTRLATLLAYHTWPLPALILKHDASLASAHFSKDGARILTVGQDGTIQQWNAVGGQPIGEPLKVSGHLLDFSPDGAKIVGDSAQNTARVWDAHSNQLLAETPSQAGPVYAARFSPDERRVATVALQDTGRGSARVWDARNGQPVTGALNLGVTSGVLPNVSTWGMDAVEFSPDGNRIVTAWRNSARIWDAQTGLPLTDALAHQAQVKSARFSPDGRRIVTASLDGTARVWDAQNGRPVTGPLTLGNSMELSQIALSTARFSADASAQFSPDGNRVLTASWDGFARVWNTLTGERLAELRPQNGQLWSASFSPDGRWILTASEDGSARLWDARGGQPLLEALRHDGPVYSAQFSPDGARIVTASSDKTARVWNVRGAQSLPEPLKLPAGASSAQLCPDFRRILTASADGIARVWDAQSGLPLTPPMQQEGSVSWARFSPDANRIVTVGLDSDQHGIARVWDARSGLALTPPLRNEAAISSAQFSPDGQRLVTASADKSARVWNVQAGQLLQATLEHGGAVLGAQFSLDGNRVLTACADGTARLWDVAGGKPIASPMKHDGPVNSAQFSPDDSRIVTASEDMTARVWDAGNGRPLTGSLPQKAPARSAQFSPDGARIVIVCDDQSARVWDARGGLPLTGPLQHEGQLDSAQFSPSGERILTVAKDRAGHLSARLWDAQTGQPLTEPLSDIGARQVESRQASGQFSADGRRVVVGLAIWDLPPEARCPAWLPALADAISGQILNPQGVLQPASQNPAPFLSLLRQTLNQTTNQDPWSVWGRWLLAEPSARTISPYSVMTLPNYIENRIQENTPESLDRAEWLAAGNPALLERVSAIRMIAPTRSEAVAFAAQNQLSSAEVKYRQLLALDRKAFADDPLQWQNCVEALADVLIRERKSADIQQLFENVLPPAAGGPTQSAGLLYLRGCARARTGQWNEAESDFSKLIELEPGNPRGYYALAPLLIETGNLDAFRRHCANSLAKFGGTEDPAAASSIAKSCLLLPPTASLSSGAFKLAGAAIASGQHSRFVNELQFTKALAEYRQGDFITALQSTRQIIAQSGNSPSLEAQAYIVQAMSQFQLRQADQARGSLAKGLEIIERNLPKAATNDLSADWIEWISAHTLAREAKALIGA